MRDRHGTRGIWLALLGAAACVTAPPQPAPGVAAPPAPAAKAPGFVRYPEAEVAHLKNIHQYRGKPVCQACHAGDAAGLLPGPAGRCEMCHVVPHSPGHEVGTRFVRKFPVPLPLAEGKVACHTCHDPHNIKRERFGLRKAVNVLCLDCHPGH